MKKTGQQMKAWPPGVRRRVRQAIYDFHVRAFDEEMVDHAVRKGVKFDKPALGLTPQANSQGQLNDLERTCRTGPPGQPP